MEALPINTSIFCTYKKTCENVMLREYKHGKGFLLTQPKMNFNVYNRSGSGMDSLISNGSVSDTNSILSEPDYRKASRANQTTDGIGITKILQGKTLLITGATGYLGKAIVEKILRAIPDVHKMFIMVKGKSKEAAMERLRREIVESELFKCLQEQYGESYQYFILNKIVPVLGNVGETNLGLDGDVADMLKKEVEIILNCAANTGFNERYDMMLDVNTYGPSRLMSFAKECHNIMLFMQISTAFVHGRRDGRYTEKPINASNFENPLNIEHETKLVLEVKQGIENEKALTQEMKQLGIDRASKFGRQNAYTLTKVMGEMMLNTLKGDLPVVIVRPSCIKSTYREPFPGWIEGTRLLDPVILSYGKGQLTGFVAKPGNDPDIIPLDVIVNATIAAMAMHVAAGNPKNLIYQVTSSVSNTVRYDDLMDLFYEHFKDSPVINTNGTPLHISRMKLLSSMEEFHSHYSGENERSSSDHQASVALPKLNKKILQQLEALNNMYKEFTLCDARFDCTNTKALVECMSKEEKQQFGCDVTDIDWREYIVNIHIPGFRTHVMKGRLG